MESDKKKESLGNILEKCNMAGKIKVSIKKQTHNCIMWAVREINLFYHGFYKLRYMTDLFLQVKGWAIQLFIINKTGVSVQLITKQLIHIHFIDTFRVHLNVNGLTLVNVSFETTRTEWLQLQKPPGSMTHLIQHWQLQGSQLNTHTIAYHCMENSTSLFK